MLSPSTPLSQRWSPRMRVALSPGRTRRTRGLRPSHAFGQRPLPLPAWCPGKDRAPDRQASKGSAGGHTSRLADRQTDKQQEKRSQGQVDRDRSPPPPPRSAPAPTADTGAQIYLPTPPQSAIGFVITDSNVHGINILTN